MIVDCYDFYLWSIGLLQLKQKPELTELLSAQEEQ